MRKKELTGCKFGRLTVLKQAHNGPSGICWECVCDCGNTKTALGASLRRGVLSSCGCLVRDTQKTAPQRWKEVTKTCEHCNRPFTCRTTMSKYCSQACRQASWRGIANKYRATHWLECLLRNSKFRAGRRKEPHDLDIKYLQDMLTAQQNKCSKTGVPFIISVEKGIRGRSPWSLSIDRIDSARGYIKGNIQLVCLMYNLCKGTWTDGDVRQFTKAVQDYE